jgi:hypothetical protein
MRSRAAVFVFVSCWAGVAHAAPGTPYTDKFREGPVRGEASELLLLLGSGLSTTAEQAPTAIPTASAATRPIEPSRRPMVTPKAKQSSCQA